MECTFYLSEWEMSCLAKISLFSSMANSTYYYDLDKYVGITSRLFDFVRKRPNFFSIKTCYIDYPTILGMKKQTVLVFKKPMPDAIDLIQCEPRFFRHCIQTPELVERLMEINSDAIVHIKNPTDEQKIAIMRLRPNSVLWFSDLNETRLDDTINISNFWFENIIRSGVTTSEINLVAKNKPKKITK